MVQIRFEDIRKAFGTFEALRGIDLIIEDGEFVVFVGPSGCGKSTLLRIIAGLEEGSGGAIYFGEKRFTDVPPAKRGVAMVFQSYALYPHMNVADNMTMSMRLAGVPRPQRRARAEEVAKMLQLTPYLDRKPGQLSGGQRQRVAIGRAIVRAPDVYLFDEPLSNLDAALRVETRVSIAQLHRSLGNTMIYVTHDQVEAMTMADRIVVMNEGQIAQAGTPLELYHHPANLFVAGFIGSPKMNLIPVAETSRSETGRVVKLGDLPPITLTGRYQGGEATTLGVRPERLHVAAEGPLRGLVTAVEHLGSETLVYAQVEGSNIVAKAVDDLNVKVDETVGFSFLETDYYLFDEQGVALRSS